MWKLRHQVATAFLWLQWNPVKLGSCVWLQPALGFLLMCVQKAIWKQTLLWKGKILRIMLSLPVRINGKILEWKFPRVFPRVWFYQDHHFQLSGLICFLLIQASLWEHLCMCSREKVGKHTLSQKRVLSSALPESCFLSQELNFFLSAYTIAPWWQRW